LLLGELVLAVPLLTPLGSFGTDEGFALRAACCSWSHEAYWACETALTLKNMREW
jgi:hypothetical protein